MQSPRVDMNHQIVVKIVGFPALKRNAFVHQQVGLQISVRCRNVFVPTGAMSGDKEPFAAIIQRHPRDARS